jgi:hypothetical protein
MADSIDRLVHARIGDYALVRVIGRGTHYTLFQAVDPHVRRMVVIKILHVADVAEGGDGVAPTRESAQIAEARLQREARALASLSHPNIPALYGNGEEGGQCFLVMEYIYGHPLRQHLDLNRVSDAEAAGILEQVAGAVDAAHAQSILHRDIRASNVIIAHDGQVKLVDFGLARQPGDATVTMMGDLVGEPAYMAPEQLLNKPATQASDLWALGVLLYEMLAGHAPFQGANFPLVAHQVIGGQPLPVPGVSAAVQAVLDKALEKDPEKRYRRGADLAGAFRKAAGIAPSAALHFETVPGQSGAPRAGRLQGVGRTGVFLGAGVLGMAASILIGISLSRPLPAADPPPAAAPPPAVAAPLSVPAPVPAPVTPAPVPAPVTPAAVPAPVTPAAVSFRPASPSAGASLFKKAAPAKAKATAKSVSAGPKAAMPGGPYASGIAPHQERLAAWQPVTARSRP